MRKGYKTGTIMEEYSTYNSRYVTGSVAYDYSNIDAFPEYAPGRQVEIPAARKLRDEVVTDTRVVSQQAVSPTAILGFALAAILLVFSLFARTQLNQTALQVVQLQNQLEELEAEHQKLLIEYEFAFNLAEIEDYAIRELGMQQPYSDQMVYINSGTADKAEIIQTTGEQSGVEKVFSFIGEYLG